MLLNPYNPGAGASPSFLAGREQIINDAINAMQYAKVGRPRPICYHGLRGVGKTVLLSEIKNKTNTNDIIDNWIEISENNNFKRDIITCIQATIKKLSFVESAKEIARYVAQGLKMFGLKYAPENGEFSLGVDPSVNIKELVDSGYFKEDLIAMLLLLGNLGKKAEKCICFYIDEMQYMKDEDLDALLMSMQRINIESCPILFLCAGLPSIKRKIARTKSYSERLFKLYEIDYLKEPDAKEALI